MTTGTKKLLLVIKVINIHTKCMNFLPQPKLIAVAQLNEKSQLVIPKEAREAINIGPGDKVIIALAPFADALVIAKPEELENHLKRMIGTSEDMQTELNNVKKGK